MKLEDFTKEELIAFIRDNDEVSCISLEDSLNKWMGDKVFDEYLEAYRKSSCLFKKYVEMLKEAQNAGYGDSEALNDLLDRISEADHDLKEKHERMDAFTRALLEDCENEYEFAKNAAEEDEDEEKRCENAAEANETLPEGSGGE